MGIRNKTARNMLYAWHGGMSSPFYQAASAGLVANWEALKDELKQCYYHAGNKKDEAQLAKLLEWIIKQHAECANRIMVIYGVRHNALPWEKEWKQ